MDIIYNLTALKAKMDEPPRGQRLNNFFDGAFTQLSNEQMDNLEEIMDENVKEIKAHIQDCRAKLKNQEVAND